MNLQYRKCTVDDLDQLQNVSVSTFVDAFAEDNNPDDFEVYIESAFSKKALRDQLQNPDSSFYFVHSKDKLVGYFKLNVNAAQNEKFSQKTMELERIYVLPEFIGQGIGKIILEHILVMARKENVTFLWLGVWEKNQAAIRFYERHGFEKFSTHPYYVGNDRQTDWLMKVMF